MTDSDVSDRAMGDVIIINTMWLDHSQELHAGKGFPLIDGQTSADLEAAEWVKSSLIDHYNLVTQPQVVFRVLKQSLHRHWREQLSIEPIVATSKMNLAKYIHGGDLLVICPPGTSKQKLLAITHVETILYNQLTACESDKLPPVVKDFVAFACDAKNLKFYDEGIFRSALMSPLLDDETRENYVLFTSQVSMFHQHIEQDFATRQVHLAHVAIQKPLQQRMELACLVRDFSVDFLTRNPTFRNRHRLGYLWTSAGSRSEWDSVRAVLSDDDRNSSRGKRSRSLSDSPM